MSAIDSFSHSLSSYLDAPKIQLVKRAYYYAEQAHEGQERSSGDPYITHPLAVAKILSKMQMDHHSLMAAMLHDVIEDTGISKAALADQFGDTVAELVDGVSKLTHIEFASREEEQARNFEKMAMAMAKDIRVIMVKLADRLHNMRTLGPLKVPKRRRVARETLDIYARIAGRLGMQDMRIEFEDRGFSALYPLRAKRLRAAVQMVRTKQKELLEHIKQSIEKQLDRWGIEAQVIGREKHLYSIYCKMEGKKRFRDITDVFAFRIVTKDVQTCYRVLGAVHTLYKPLIGMLKDYIAIPKANGYQSLHTILNGVQNVPVEVQIRTQEMDAIAISGIAAHWLYKSDDEGGASHARARRWIKGLLELQQHAGSSLEFIEHVKNDFFADEVYVFTPKGKIFELPAGATAVDFAYAIHTDIGNSCVACRINNRLASLSQPLENGQQVSIITSENAAPKAVWLDTAKTSKARSALRHYLKHFHHQEAVDLGRRMLERTLKTLSLSLADLDGSQMGELLLAFKSSDFDELLADIGLGNKMSSAVVKVIAPEKADELAKHVESPLTIDPTDGTVITLSRCCRPIPGDPIVGHMSSGKGLVIHLDTCKNVTDLRQDPDKLSEVSWSPEVSGEFLADLLIMVGSERGVIAELASRITADGAHIDKMTYHEKDAEHSHIKLTLGVTSRIHLATIMRKVKAMRFVEKVIRDKN